MKHTLSNTSFGATLVALSALGYSINPILGKVAYSAGANAISLGAVRFTIAAVLLWVIVAARPGQGQLALKERVRLVLMGMFGMAMVALLYFTALGYVGASLATGLFYTYPAIVTLVGMVRGQGLSAWALAGLLMTIAGTWLLLGTDFDGFSWIGAALILVAAGWYSTFILYSDRWARGVEPVTVSAHVGTGAAITYLVLALVTGQPFPAAKAILAGAGLSLLSTVLALITFFAGLVRVGSVKASIISTLEPVFTALLAVLILAERLSLLQAAGIGLVMVGAGMAQVKERSVASHTQQA